MTLTLANAVLLAGAGLLAGMINAAAGGGSLVSFPALLGAGLPALSANVTNTVALSFGYAGGALGFRSELQTEWPRVRRLGTAAGGGAVIGVVLLDVSSPDTFRALVPWLLLISCGLLGVQPIVARRLLQTPPDASRRRPAVADLLQVGAGAYGAYFGAGLGVMVLALLGLSSAEPLQRLNAVKSVITLVVNVVAAVCFVVVAPVSWIAVAIVGPTSLIGGRLGARLAKRVPDLVLRTTVIVLGVVVAGRLLIA